MTEAVATRVDELLVTVREKEEEEGGWVYQLSLEMLCWARLGRRREVCV